MPTKPISVPWLAKIATTLRGVVPKLRRIAMSPRLSSTTIMSVDTMLNAATAITSDRITNMIDFWSWIERKYV